ncbi:ribosome maturation factor RimP [Myceligenerans pegani]|uniref:Ribosome maturation factor RimP n=1 Tax=Myceligenerans pegani TaxID=2776917 RepID=A0ABR9MSZ8_9MICO|nr:ribosome maturation factor RimP [Myceligenerans sp. TRM 65318]MBE1874503.1 ribosome maturation factor RimP [Myceligenerans sp. TRM 65318]MBE3016774.1 ribosome maturation factor RimP [Myceligenerans sp. TRM 65318]
MAQPASRQEDDVRRIVGPVVDDADLYLEEVRVTRAGNRSVVRITLDLPETRIGSLDSDTLGEVSRALSAALDDGDVVAGAYTLEISTPGTSRPLTTARHFRRARTRLVTLTPAGGGEVVSGRLTDVTGDGDGTVLVLDGARRIALSDVRRGKVEVELSRPDDAGSGAAGPDAGPDEGPGERGRGDEGTSAGPAAEDADAATVSESAGADDDAVTREPRRGAAGHNEEG